jgi:hypothetical protein
MYRGAARTELVETDAATSAARVGLRHLARHVHNTLDGILRHWLDVAIRERLFGAYDAASRENASSEQEFFFGDEFGYVVVTARYARQPFGKGLAGELVLATPYITTECVVGAEPLLNGVGSGRVRSNDKSSPPFAV